MSKYVPGRYPSKAEADLPRTANSHCTRTITEIAAIFGISKQRVMQIERMALLKLRRHPIMRALAEEYGLVAESGAG